MAQDRHSPRSRHSQFSYFFSSLLTPCASAAGRAEAAADQLSQRYFAAAEALTPRQQQARVRRRAALRLEVQRPPQLTAFFTSAPILASSAAVNSFSAKATGHTVSSSRFALSLKPNVAYLALNLCALWKKQTTLPSLAYAGIP